MGATAAMAIRYCAWCGSPAVDEILVQYSHVVKKNGVPVVIAPERRAWACAEHLKLPKIDDPVTQRAQRAGRAGAWKKRQERMF